MSVLDIVFGEDIVLDQEAFDKAISDFAALGVQLNKLRSDIEEMLNELKAGFDTPAGAKLINSCEENLFKPLDDQKLVLDHISKSLSDSKRLYESVFNEYESLQAAINQVNNN